MFSPTTPIPKPAGSTPFARLASSATAPRTSGRRRHLKRAGITLLAVIAALVVLWVLFTVFVQVATTYLWFDSVHDGSVYKTSIEAQVLLFVIFGIAAGLVSGLTMWAIRRVTPLYVSPDDDTFRWLLRKHEKWVGRLAITAAVVVPGVIVGSRAANGWQTYLLWRHAKSWHTADPLFHKDISFFVDVYPFHVLVVSLLSQAVKYSLWIAVVAGYWFGLWRLRRGRQKVTRGFIQLLSLLLAAYLVLKAASYWLSRYALDTSSVHGPVTGASYTDVHAALPSKYVLMSFALLSALVLLGNALLVGRVRPAGRVRTIAGAVAVMVVVSLAAGTAWPGLVSHFRESPSAAKLDLDEIAHNQRATLAAFGLDGDVTTVPYHAGTASDASSLVQLAGRTAQVPVIDQNQLAPTFNVEQQLQAYYGFKSTLDVSHYDIDGKSQDVALAVRELKAGGIPTSSWVSKHLVYTHGYGIVAAPTTGVDPETQSPKFLDGGMPPAQQIPVTQPQVYFGQSFTGPTYSIVGQPAGSTTNLEFDHPGGGTKASNRTTYQGHGGIPIGSTWRRLLFAVQLSDPNIFFSSELNSASQLLELRDPRTRVAKVAPWLTLDGDVYPAVVGGRVEWVVDGYTTSSNYPDAQLVNLRSATRTTLTADGASVAQSSQRVNYMQNSVKAIVDAYTGQVTLYEWNQATQPDPLLKTWESVYPGLVKSQSAIPAPLLSQLRYPTDLFNVQRTLLAKYHVGQPASFYNGNDFWTVPGDPTFSPSGNSGTRASLPSKYMSMSPTGSGPQEYTLASPMVTLNGQQLAAFVSVDAAPGPDYGKFTVLDFSSGSDNSGGESPAQVQNSIESDTQITGVLTLQRGGSSKVVLGDLEAVPVAGRVLYVEPVYTQSTGSSSFPILRHVIAVYGNGQPSFDDSLDAAVKDAINSAVGPG